MLYKNITRNLVTALAINMLTCEWPWSPYSYSEILKRVVTYYFMTRRALKRKGSIDIIFLRNYRGEFFFFLKIHFKQNFNSHLYEAEDLWIIGLVAFVFCSIGMGRWYEEMCFFFFFLQQRKNWGAATSDRMEKIN